MAGGVIGYNSKGDHIRTIQSKVWSQLASIKTMFGDDGHLGWQAGSSDIILPEDHVRTIPLKFGPHWPSTFREDFNMFPIGSHVKPRSVDGGRPGC